MNLIDRYVILTITQVRVVLFFVAKTAIGLKLTYSHYVNPVAIFNRGVSMNFGLKRCPKCNSKPVYWSTTPYSGYVGCPLCLLQTKDYLNDGYTVWKVFAKHEWNTGEIKSREFMI